MTPDDFSRKQSKQGENKIRGCGCNLLVLVSLFSAMILSESVIQIFWPEKLTLLSFLLLGLVIVELVICVIAIVIIRDRLKEGRNKTGNFVLLVVVGVTGFLLFLNVFFIPTTVSSIWLQQYGTQVEATIVEHSTEVGYQKRTNHFIAYQYEITLDDGNWDRISRKQEVSNNLYSQLELESKVTVSYYSFLPTYSKIPDSFWLKSGLSAILTFQISVGFNLLFFFVVAKIFPFKKPI
jgi:cation transport ATPase